MTRALAVTRFVATVLVGAIALSASALLIVPKVLGWHGVIVLTGSMEPALRTGGIAFVDPAGPEDVHVGDIITFRRPGGRDQVTHRVVEITASSDGARIRTKGDANEVADGWVVREGDLVGKVRYSFPYLGRLIHALLTQRVLLAGVMLGAAAFLVVDDVRRSRRGRARPPGGAEQADAGQAAEPLDDPAPHPQPDPTPVVVARRPRRRPSPAEMAGPGLAVALPVLATAVARDQTRRR